MKQKPFKYQGVTRAIHEFIMQQNDNDLVWAWEVARGCVEVYAKNLVFDVTLDEARANAWEQFTGVFVGNDAYAGMGGLADEIILRLPDADQADRLVEVVTDARTRAGRPPERAVQTPPTPQTTNNRPFLRLVQDD